MLRTARILPGTFDSRQVRPILIILLLHVFFVQPCNELYIACVEVYDESEIMSRVIL